MGYYKNVQQGYIDRGYGATDMIICSDCFDDYIIKKFINDNGELIDCEFCESSAMGIRLEKIMNLIFKGIEQEYEDANENVAWEDGYQGVTTWDPSEFVNEIVAVEIGTEDNNILEELLNIMNDVVWANRDPYGERPDDEMLYTWEKFSEEVKNENNISKLNIGIMDKVIDGVKDFKLVRCAEIDEKIYRARFHNEREVVKTAKQLSSPDVINASDNRMSKKGQPMFYGAFDIETAMFEAQKKENESITIGEFYLQRGLKLIDFSKLKEVRYISLFDIEKYSSRILLSFLKRFNEEISKPISEDDKSKGEYIPTQVLTKHLMNNFRTDDDERIEGIIYDSSGVENKKCVVLFLSNDDASDKKDRTLYLDQKNIVTYSYLEYLEKKEKKKQLTIEEKEKINDDFLIEVIKKMGLQSILEED